MSFGAAIGVAVLSLVIASLVLAVLQRMIKVVLYVLLAVVLVGGTWWMVRDQAKGTVAERWEAAALSTADKASKQGAKLASRAGREAAAIGAEVAKELGARVEAEGRKAVAEALGTQDTDTDRAPAGGDDGT